ncbi:RNA-directed DNA polymerase, eukaryota, reverse transcriptase zinc-binding domain protein [Tanacetum coccineum]
MHDGIWVTDPTHINELFLNFFKDKFRTHESNVGFPPIVHSSGLNSIDRDHLEANVSLDEIKSAIWDCGSNKAPVMDSVVNGVHGLESVFTRLEHRVFTVLFLMLLILVSFEGINLGSPDITISHLFYTDDVVITTEWKKEDLDNIIHVLYVFYLASGLKINIHKSNIYGIVVSDEEVFDMATFTGCTAGAFPFSYLGLPIGYNMNRVPGWQILIDRFKSRLSSWKANLLSIGGRLTLIKSVLGSLDSKKLAWIKWTNVLSSFEKWDLNIGSLKAFNLALLQKWRWRMYSFPNALWVKIIKALHGQEGGFDNHGCKFNGTWARIVGSSNYLHSKDIIPLNSFRFQAGLYRLERDKDCLIIDRINNGHWSWNWSRSDIGVRNMAYLHDLLLEISLVDTHPVEDSCLWSLANDVNIFIWRLSLDRLPHRLNLSSRGIDIPKISCSSCNGNVESSNHIFFACDIAMEVWRLVHNWCDITIPLFTSFEHWKNWFVLWQSSKEKKNHFYVIVASSLWWLGRFCNSVTFCSHPMRKSDIFDNIRSSSFSWLFHMGHMACNWVDWLKSPLLIARCDFG